MTFCTAILTPVVILVRTFVRVVRDVVRTVCGWVSSVVRTVRTVVERVCRSLPWPLSALCNLVTKVIEVFETVWNWVCREVLERIVDWIEKIVEYVAYILRWICWVVAWVWRGPALLLCRLGFRPRRFLHICVKVLTDAEGRPAVGWDQVDRDVDQAREILERCGIELVVVDRERLAKPEFLDGTTCDVGGMFSDFFTWFAARECGGCSSVTVYYVRSIPGAIGCAYPGSNWVTVAAAGDGRTMVQEIGHLCDLWGHSEDPDNVMTDRAGGTADQITEGQCCMFRTSRFALPAPCPTAREADAGHSHGGLAAPEGHEVGRHSHGFAALRAKGPESRPVLVSQVAQAALAVLVVAWAGRRAVHRSRR